MNVKKRQDAFATNSHPPLCQVDIGKDWQCQSRESLLAECSSLGFRSDEWGTSGGRVVCGANDAKGSEAAEILLSLSIKTPRAGILAPMWAKIQLGLAGASLVCIKSQREIMPSHHCKPLSEVRCKNARAGFRTDQQKSACERRTSRGTGLCIETQDQKPS
jgi:hypothetical protein